MTSSGEPNIVERALAGDVRILPRPSDHHNQTIAFRATQGCGYPDDLGHLVEPLIGLPTSQSPQQTG